MRWLIPVVLLAVASPAVAQPLTRQAEDEAKAQYDRGVVAYNLERFDDAIAAFSRAYELDPAPILLFNIAQARWKKGENDRALFYYRRYLEADPAATNRAQVEARMRELEAAPRSPPPVAVVAPPPEPPSRPAPAPVFVQARPEPAPDPAPQPFYRRGWFWGAAGAVTAVAAGVLIFALTRDGASGCAGAECNLGRVTVPGP